MYLWARERETKVDCFYLTDSFDEQPVFPDEALGILAVSPKENSPLPGEASETSKEHEFSSWYAECDL